MGYTGHKLQVASRIRRLKPPFVNKTAEMLESLKAPSSAFKQSFFPWRQFKSTRGLLKQRVTNISLPTLVYYLNLV